MVDGDEYQAGDAASELHVTAAPPGQAAPSPLRMAVRIVVGLALLFVTVALLSSLFRAELTALGHRFVDRFGLWGMVAGAAFSDAFHFPIPPQFYMLMGITSGVPTLWTLAAVNLGSFIGGWIAYFMTRRISHVGAIARRLQRAQGLLDRVIVRYGHWALVAAGFMPITYSALCYLAGLGRVSKRGFAIISLIRVPRLVAYYYLVRLGWTA